jgi:hypothetical protein
VELFFKLIEQQLRIKQFYETPENAVKTLRWIAMSVYIFVVIVYKGLRLEASSAASAAMVRIGARSRWLPQAATAHSSTRHTSSRILQRLTVQVGLREPVTSES